MKGSIKRLLINDLKAPYIYGRRWKRNPAERHGAFKRGIELAYLPRLPITVTDEVGHA